MSWNQQPIFSNHLAFILFIPNLRLFFASNVQLIWALTLSSHLQVEKVTKLNDCRGEAFCCQLRTFCCPRSCHRHWVELFILCCWCSPAEIYVHVLLNKLFPTLRIVLIEIQCSYQSTLQSLSKLQKIMLECWKEGKVGLHLKKVKWICITDSILNKMTAYVKII